MVRGWVPFAYNPVPISIQPARVAQVSPQDGLRVGLAREVTAIVPMTLANILHRIESSLGGRSTRFGILAETFTPPTSSSF